MARAEPHPSYDVSENTYSLKRDSLKARGWETEVGDRTVSNRFVPRVKVGRWSDGFLEFGVPGALHGGGDNLVHDGEAIVWSRGIYSARFYDWILDPDDQEGNGSFEFEFVLAAPPSVNSFTLDLRRQNVELLYQPPLTAQEIADGHVRPDRVVGSYAVYHSSKRDHRPGQPNYECGKIGHLYRPRVTDANGDWIWGEWNADAGTTGQLTLTVDAAWLASAVYPVTIDPTFGYDQAGQSTVAGGTSIAYGNSNASYQYTASSGDTATKITAHCKKSSGSPQLKVAIYDVSGADPNNLTVQDSITPPAGSSAWTDSGTFSQSLAAGTTYTVAWTAGATSFTVSYDSGASQDASRDNVSGGAFNDPWTEDLSFNAYLFSVYATYTAAASASGRVTAVQLDVTHTEKTARATASQLDVTYTEKTGRVTAAQVDAVHDIIGARATAADLFVTFTEKTARATAAELESTYTEKTARATAADLDVTFTEKTGRVTAVELDATHDVIGARATAAQVDITYTQTVSVIGKITAIQVDLTYSEKTARATAAQVDATFSEKTARATAVELDVTYDVVGARATASDLEITYTEKTGRITAAEIETTYLEKTARATAAQVDATFSEMSARITATDLVITYSTTAATARMTAIQVDIEYSEEAVQTWGRILRSRKPIAFNLVRREKPRTLN